MRAPPVRGWARSRSARASASSTSVVVGVTHSDGAERVLLAGDESALPAMAGILRDLPRNARGTALIEVSDVDDRKDVAAPDGVDVHWIVRGPGERAGECGLVQPARPASPRGIRHGLRRGRVEARHRGAPPPRERVGRAEGRRDVLRILARVVAARSRVASSILGRARPGGDQPCGPHGTRRTAPCSPVLGRFVVRNCGNIRGDHRARGKLPFRDRRFFAAVVIVCGRFYTTLDAMSDRSSRSTPMCLASSVITGFTPGRSPKGRSTELSAVRSRKQTESNTVS